MNSIQKIMVPVDLAHTDKLDHALEVAAGLAKAAAAPVVYVGVTATTPTSLAATPEVYAGKLTAFAEDQGAAHGITALSHAVPSTDPTVDLDKKLIAAAADTGSDLIVMASHVPGVAEHLFASNAGYVAAHAPCSVYVVR